MKCHYNVYIYIDLATAVHDPVWPRELEGIAASTVPGREACFSRHVLRTAPFPTVLNKFVDFFSRNILAR